MTSGVLLNLIQLICEKNVPDEEWKISTGQNVGYSKRTIGTVNSTG
jgi:hypothetical protein